MKYALWVESDSGIVQYTYFVLKHLISINGHALVGYEDSDFILVSLCDVSQIKRLKELREKYSNKKIIVGGHFSIFFKLCVLFCNYVYVGQGFEFFKCKNEDEIRALKSVYYEGCNKIIEPSVLIEWDKIPLAKITKNSYYYWNSVGCKNKCKFCLTSWTNKYQCNNKDRIISILGKKNISFISNENDNLTDIKENRKSMMLKDFLKIDRHYCNYYRIGLEFATEKNRKENGKYFTNFELYEAMKKAIKDKVRIQFFCIAGLDTKEEWEELFSSMPAFNSGWEIKFKFTNLEYQMFTPLYKKLKEVDIKKYIDQEWLSNLYYKYIRNIMKCGRIEKIKYPAYALWRTGMTNSINTDQFNVFYKLRNCKDINIIKDAIMENEIYNNDYSNELKMWYNNG